MNKVKYAFSIVNEAFKDKKDRAGKPYINHLLRVSDTVAGWAKLIGLDNHESVVAAAFLHDILEDCKEWKPGRLEAEFGYEISRIVSILDKGIQRYEIYILYVSTDKMASLIKLADLKDNMDLTRLETITEKDIERTKKYHAAYQQILQAWPEFKELMD